MTRHPSLPMAALAAIGALTAGSSALAQAPQGETLFKQQCATCHTIAPGAAKQGPSLQGVVGRKAGTLAGYAFSPALKAWGKTWTTANLDQYLAKPTTVVPGTKMMVGMPNAAQRAAVVSYLATQK